MSKPMTIENTNYGNKRLWIRINRTRDLVYGNRVCVLFKNKINADLFKKLGCRTSSAGNQYFTAVLSKSFFESLPCILKDGKDVDLKSIDVVVSDTVDCPHFITSFTTMDHNSYYEKQYLTKPETINKPTMTLAEVFETLDEYQKTAVYYIIGEALKENNVDIDALVSPKPSVHHIKKVIYNPPATIVLLGDDTKTVVKCTENENYDGEKGLAMCICQKMLGDKYKKTFKLWKRANYNNGGDES